ncbi:hypothetical protein KAT80_03830 [Candidatus Pacearchaeota archaeon]|nr:hypothetical protein [Candidatus Pacearchaeota archaeon]
MTIINSVKFGSITIDNKTYSEDVKILPSGKVLKRWGPKGSHTICLEEFNEILKEKPSVIIIGTGYHEIAKLELEAKKQIKTKGIKLIIESTPKAVISFNNLNRSKGGLFHLTC